MEELNKQLDFIIELDRLKGIYRQALVKSDKIGMRIVQSIAGTYH